MAVQSSGCTIESDDLQYNPLVGATRQSAVAKGKARGRAAAKKAAQEREVGTPERRQAWRGNPCDHPVRWETAAHASEQARTDAYERRVAREAVRARLPGVPFGRRLGH